MLTKLRAVSALALLCCLSLPAPAQTLKVLTAGAFKQVVLAFVPAFEAKTGMKVQVENDTAGALVRRVQSNEAFDVLFLPPGGMDILSRDGKVDAATTQVIAKVAIGIAVKTGAAHPSLDTVEQFKDAVRNARKVAYIDPASGGSSGIYLDGLFRRLGIADEVGAKAILVAGGLVADRVASGEADLAIHQVSEILPVKGVELAGLLPDSIQNYTAYAGAVSSATLVKQEARRFLEALTAPDAAGTVQSKGMVPAR